MLGHGGDGGEGRAEEEGDVGVPDEGEGLVRGGVDVCVCVGEMNTYIEHDMEMDKAPGERLVRGSKQ